MRTYWTPEMESILRELYPNNLSQTIADKLGVPLSSIYNKAHALKLKKDKEWVIENSRYNMQFNENAKNSSFKKGQVPPNKGKKQTEYMSIESIEKCKATRFKKGQTPHNTKPDHYEALRPDSKGSKYWMIKLPKAKKMIHKHVWLWEEKHGKVKQGYIVVFKDRNTLNCIIDNLECISREENMLRNSHRCDYPKELIPEYAKISQITKLIKKKSCQN